MESRQKECDFIFYSTLRRKQRGNGFATLLKTATPIIGVIPGGGAAATTAAGAAGTAGAATTDQVLKTATDVSGLLKAKDEVSLEFKLAAQGAAAARLANVLKATARKDGDQVISTLLAQAANAALQAVTQK